MGIVFKNNAKTTLASSLSNSATSATVTDGGVFPTLGAGEFFLITFDDGTNNEICKCTARSSNTLTIVRAQDNTSARAFSSGDAAEGRVTAGVLETIQENIAAKSADQTVYNATTASSATAYDIGIDPGVEANAMVFLDGVMQHHDTFSFSGSTLTFDAAPTDGTKLEVIVDNLINLQSSNLTVDSFTAADVGGSAQTAFTLSDTPAAETNLIVFVEGVFQDQDAYTISSSTLTITTGVIAGRGVTVYVINPVNIGTPSDGTITSAKLSGNLTLPGTLTVGANDVAFDSPTFVVDNSNSRVGLGTASPTVPVDIVGETKMSSHLTLGTTSKVQFGDSGTYIHQSADGVLDLVSDNEIEINATTVDVNGALDVSGNITGTLATAAQTNITSVGTLTGFTSTGIDDNADATAITIDSSENVTFASNITMSNASSPTILMTDTTNTLSLKMFSGNTTASIGTTTNHALTFFTNDNERVHITNAGNVGIGTASPATTLNIQSATPIFRGTDSDDVDKYGQIEFNNGDIVISADANSGGGYHGASKITLCVDSGGEKMRITNDGKIGIGTTSPDYRLVVRGAAATNDNIFKIEDSAGTKMASMEQDSSGNGRWIVCDTSGNADVLIHTAGNSYFNGGNVGIGTTAPDNKLHVYKGASGHSWSFDGDDALILENNDSVSFNIATPNSNTANILFSDAAARGQGRIVYDHGSDYMAFMTNGISSEKMRIHSGGTLSIGTTVSNVSNFGGNPPKLFVTASGVNNRCANFYYGSTDNYEAVEFSHDRATGSNTAIIMGFRNAAGSSIGTIACTASATAYNTSSDARKKNVISEASGLDTIQKLNPVKFEWKDSGLIESGLIAQEVLEVEDTAYTVKENTDGYYVMDYSKLVTPLVKAIQEQQTIIEDLKARIETLEG